MQQKERNRAALIRMYDEAFNAGRLDVIDECIAEGAREHRHPMDEGEDLRDHVRTIVRMLRAAMPDVHVVVEETVAEGNLVFARLTTTGTHTGAPLFGMPARGCAVHVPGFHLVEFDGEARAVRDAGEFSVDEMIRQVTGSAAAMSA